jgi:molybdate transport system ATP-binding protein
MILPAAINEDASTQSLIVFEEVTLRIRDRHILPATDWRIKKHQNWVVLGPNGSGKSTLLRALTGDTPVVGGHIRRHGFSAQPHAIGFVSFELHQRILAEEQSRDEARHFSGKIDSYLTVAEFIEDPPSRRPRNKLNVSQLVSAFGIETLMPRPVRKLSNGEMRKLLIVKAVMNAHRLLILDEPFAGLDDSSREQLKGSIAALIRTGIQVILATHRHENILADFSHILCLKAGKVFCQGRRDQTLSRETIRRVFEENGRPSSTGRKAYPPARASVPKGTAVIDVRHATVRYGNTCVFTDLNWKVHKGENWAVIGPNGSGKTTLLQLIAADHPQAYANEIYLFGRRRGSGESIWEIKRHLGVLSSELQINYRKPIRAFDVVISGFFSSVGLYRRAGSQQKHMAEKWIHRLNLSYLRDRRFDLLSYGERRIILLARAIVNAPEILILDEPCQGLDMAFRKRVLALIDEICRQTQTQLLYVTHHLAEMPDCIHRILDMGSRRPFQAFPASRTSSIKGSMSPSSTALTLPISRLTR